ncbi:unnamed protein product [Timema podura]|uniref:Uncharacterized protein n=1 Tax=Timema podura TaxID=61482 RepID=A0ABN7NGW3_TIMPD|nr:unnamed protein product [Timema podura]
MTLITLEVSCDCVLAHALWLSVRGLLTRFQFGPRAVIFTCSSGLIANSCARQVTLTRMECVQQRIDGDPLGLREHVTFDKLACVVTAQRLTTRWGYSKNANGTIKIPLYRLEEAKFNGNWNRSDQISFE